MREEAREMGTPFEELGLRAWAEPEEVRQAYRTLVKKCHPDRVQDPAEKEAAQQRMIRLNLAYEEALRLSAPREKAAYHREISLADALALAERMLGKEKPESALRQLMRAESRNAEWYEVYGRILMRMEHFHEAELAFREAIRREPENNAYRGRALEASLADKRSKTFSGRVRRIFGGRRKEGHVKSSH